MTGFNHTLAGSIIGVLAPAPLAPILALVSHFVLDALPHFGNHPKINVDKDGKLSKSFKILLVIDAFLCVASLLFACWLFPTKWLIIVISAGFAAGPDFLWLFEPRATSPLVKKFFSFAKRIQWAEWPNGWVLEVIYGALMLLFLLNISS